MFETDKSLITADLYETLTHLDLNFAFSVILVKAVWFEGKNNEFNFDFMFSHFLPILRGKGTF